MTYQTMTCQVCLGFGQVDIFTLSIIIITPCLHTPSPPPPHKYTYLPPPKLASFDVFKINALGNMQFSQEHLKTTVYAKFGDQAVCIMGDSKVENWSSLSPPPTPHATKPSIRDDPFTRK